ncbi:MAG: hypothetical protein ABIT38_10260, partial [Gemmatimonadaceae bacterium]
MSGTRLFSTAFHITLVALIIACSPREKSAEESPAAKAPTSAFRVALLTPGPISDQSWNGGAYQGLMRIRD